MWSAGCPLLDGQENLTEASFEQKWVLQCFLTLETFKYLLLKTVPSVSNGPDLWWNVSGSHGVFEVKPEIQIG